MVKIILSILKKRNYSLLFIGITILFFGISILIPVYTATNNNLTFQLKTYSGQDFILMAFLAGLIGLTFSLQIYAYKKRSCTSLQSISQGATTGISGVFAAIVGTASCTSCLLPLFTIIGVGSDSVFFIFKNNIYFVLGIIILMFIFLYFTVKKIEKTQNPTKKKVIKTTSTITCPKCGHQKEETMPTNACQHTYQCSKCKTMITPKKGDCCVFCSYGDNQCPPKQKESLKK